MLDQGQAPPLSQETRKPVNPLMRRKPVERLVSEGGQGEGGSLRRSLTMWQLTMISIGATLGTGIFVVLGTAAPKAGPAVTISFVLAGLTALFSALSYAELAGSVPVSGSSYSYAYATMASSSPGSAAGAWSWSTPSPSRPWPSAGASTSTSSSTGP